MNKERRKTLETILEMLEDVIVCEQDAFDNMPESLQYSERGESIEEGIQNLEEAKELIDDIVNT